MMKMPKTTILWLALALLICCSHHPRSALDLDKLLTFYRAPGYETLVDEHIIDFEI